MTGISLDDRALRAFGKALKGADNRYEVNRTTQQYQAGLIAAQRAGTATDYVTAMTEARAALLEPDQLAAHLSASGVAADAGNPIVKAFTKLVREDIPAAAGYSREAIRTEDRHSNPSQVAAVHRNAG